jgi:hypothetical protein
MSLFESVKEFFGISSTEPEPERELVFPSIDELRKKQDAMIKEAIANEYSNISRNLPCYLRSISQRLQDGYTNGGVSANCWYAENEKFLFGEIRKALPYTDVELEFRATKSGTRYLHWRVNL